VRRATALALLGLLALAPCAQASSDPLGSGTTKLVLDKGFLAFLKKDEVTLSATAPARLKAGTLTLPVSGGLIDPTTGKGTIEQTGALVFQNARKKLPFKDVAVKTKHSPLIAKVGGSQLKVATSAKLAFKREGFGTDFSAKALKLSAKVAERLNKKLRPKAPFAEGQPIGTLKSRTQPLTTAILEAGRATLVFDPGFLAKLNALTPKVSLNPIFPAEHQGATFTFPIIVGGAIAPDASTGTLRTGGDVELLQLGGGQLFWHEFWLDLGARTDSAEANLQPSPPYAGKTGRIPLFDASMAAASVSQDPRARTISVSGAPLTLQAPTAKALNELFAEGKEDFRAGEALGSLSFTAQGQ
jgi:hypothetical protein